MVVAAHGVSSSDTATVRLATIRSKAWSPRRFAGA